MPTPSTPPARDDRVLLSVRSAVILLAAIFIGFLSGLLVFAGEHDLAKAALAAGAALGSSIVLLNQIIATNHKDSAP